MSTDLATVQLRAKLPGSAELVPVAVDRLISFELETAEDALNRVRLTLANEDLSLFTAPEFARGAEIHYTFGFAAETRNGRAIIKEVSGGPETLEVTAYDRRCLLDSIPISKTFENTTRSAVVAEAVKAAGLKVEVEDTRVRTAVSIAGTTVMEAIAKWSEREGYSMTCDGDAVRWAPRDFSAQPIATLTYRTDEVGSIIDFTVRTVEDRHGAAGRKKVGFRDPLHKRSGLAKGDNKTAKRFSLAAVLDVANEDDGDLARNITREQNLMFVGSAAEADRIAQGRYKKAIQQTHELSLTVYGDTRFITGRLIRVENLSPRWSGLWYIREARHRIAAGEYTTELVCIRDAHGGHRGKNRAEVKTAGNVNTQAPRKKGERQQVEEVSEVDGSTRVVWKD